MTLAKPDPTLTPGVFTDTRTPRHVTGATARAVYRAYGIGLLRRPLYVIDHLVPLELCGTNDITNLWPQPRRQAHLKDLDENRLATAVRTKRMTLAAAQQEMLSLWGPVPVV